MRHLVIICMALMASQASAGWNDWSEEQRTAVKNWINIQPWRDTVALKDAITKRPIESWHDWDENIPRDRITVQSEKMLKRIATKYSITKSTSPAQANQLFLDAYQAAPNQAQKDEALDDKHMFWICFITLRSVDVSGDVDRVVHHHDPVYGDSFAQLNNLGGANGYDIEEAIRSK